MAEIDTLILQDDSASFSSDVNIINAGESSTISTLGIRAHISKAGEYLLNYDAIPASKISNA